MNLTDVAHSRLINQQIAETKFRTAKELVNWMGAMQAQDYHMAKWAIGSRLPHLTENQIATALDSGDLIRTHLLRPTWHIVSAEDIYWMLELTAPHVKALIKSRNKELGLTDALFSKSNTIIEKALEGGRQLTRQELMAELGKANIVADSVRAAHLMFEAELDGIIANGACREKQQTYALLEERVPKPKPLLKDEALAKLAQTYFVSHSPATLADFIWWSGLSVTMARHALELIKSSLISEQIERQTYWFAHSVIISENVKESLHLLPAFDEYTISYKDRSAVLTLENHTQAISGNGIFNPIIVLNGIVVGTWKRIFKNDKTIVEPRFFQTPAKAILHLLENACVPLSHFFNQKIEIVYNL